jgi:hypothetical protein
MADIESHNAAGAKLLDGSNRELMRSEWTSDGGHLNDAGARRVASAWWWLMARIAGWSDNGMSLNQGWNLVSIPRIQSNYAASLVFPGLYGSVFRYDAASGSYVQAVNLVLGEGYWVYFTSAVTIAMNGSAPGIMTKQAQAGWHLIGSDSSLIQVSSLALSNGATIYGSAFRFNTLTGSYEGAAFIKPGEAIWIYLTKACTISIP